MTKKELILNQKERIDDEQILVLDLVECSYYLTKEITLRKGKKFPTLGHISDNMTGTTSKSTYLSCAQNVLANAKKICKNPHLMKKIEDTHNRISESDIGDVKVLSHFYNPKQSTDIEDRLYFYSDVLVCELGLGNMGIMDASKETGIASDTIKQACQDGRLFNVSKVGKGWSVNICEVREYWNVK